MPEYEPLLGREGRGIMTCSCVRCGASESRIFCLADANNWHNQHVCIVPDLRHQLRLLVAYQLRALRVRLIIGEMWTQRDDNIQFTTHPHVKPVS